MSHALYFRLAREIAKESTCPRASVGALLIQDDRPVAMGYNGAPRGVRHCDVNGCWLYTRARRKSCFLAVHAELNVLLNAGYAGAKTLGGTIYCTHSPCVDCLKAMINAGIQTVYYEHLYHDPLAFELYKLAVDEIMIMGVNGAEFSK